MGKVSKGQRSGHLLVLYPSQWQVFLTFVRLRIRVPVWSHQCWSMIGPCSFPSVSVSVMFVATWKLEAAALIETLPPSLPQPTHSLSLF